MESHRVAIRMLSASLLYRRTLYKKSIFMYAQQQRKRRQTLKLYIMYRKRSERKKKEKKNHSKMPGFRMWDATRSTECDKQRWRPNRSEHREMRGKKLRIRFFYFVSHLIRIDTNRHKLDSSTAPSKTARRERETNNNYFNNGMAHNAEI